jgi:hypothetical protein
MSHQVIFAVDEVTLEQNFLRALRFSLTMIAVPLLHTHLSSSYELGDSPDTATPQSNSLFHAQTFISDPSRGRSRSKGILISIMCVQNQDTVEALVLSIAHFSVSSEATLKAFVMVNVFVSCNCSFFIFGVAQSV